MNPIIYHYLRLRYVVRKWLFRQFTLTGLGVLFCLIISALVGLGSIQSMSHLIFFLSLSLLGIAILGCHYIQYRFSVKRILPRFGTLREPLQYRIVLQNLTPERQTGLQYIEAFSEPFPSFREFTRLKKRHPNRREFRKYWRRRVARQQWAIAHPQALPILSARAKAEIIGEVFPLRRGRLYLEAISFICPDPLGLLNKRQTYALPESVCILPKRYQLPPLNLASLSTNQMGEALLTSSVGEALEFRSLRDYRPGDPTNKIHWKSWAKFGRPITKEQQEESAVHHALIIDTFQPESYSQVFEEAIAIAVSYVAQERAEDAMLDVLFASPDPYSTTIGRGLGHREQILETLATLTPCQTKTIDTLNPIVQARLLCLSGCICIFLNFDEARQAFLKQLIQSGVPVKALVLSPKNQDSNEGKDSHVRQESFPSFQSPQCHVHFISMGQIQQDLLRI